MLSLFSTHVPNFTTPYGVVTPNSTPGSSPAQHRTTSTKPVTIPASNNRATKVVNGFTISMSQKPLDTPPMTPDSSLGDDRWLEDADGDLKFLREVFPDPESVRAAGRYARGVSIAQEGVTFEGFVLALPGQAKTLYVCGKGAESVQLRESIVALLDLADEHLGCNAFVIALERESPALAGLIHSLMYVSGQVVSRPPFRVDDRWVLVGIEV